MLACSLTDAALLRPPSSDGLRGAPNLRSLLSDEDLEIASRVLCWTSGAGKGHPLSSLLGEDDLEITSRVSC